MRKYEQQYKHLLSGTEDQEHMMAFAFGALKEIICGEYSGPPKDRVERARELFRQYNEKKRNT